MSGIEVVDNEPKIEQPEPDAHANPKNLPKMTLFWDAELQQVRVAFDTREIKNWAMASMILNEAIDLAKFQKNLIQAQAVQQRAAEAMQEEIIRQQLQQAGRGRKIAQA